jgi:hypothetical protein
MKHLVSFYPLGDWRHRSSHSASSRRTYLGSAALRANRRRSDPAKSVRSATAAALTSILLFAMVHHSNAASGSIPRIVCRATPGRPTEHLPVVPFRVACGNGHIL